MHPVGGVGAKEAEVSKRGFTGTFPRDSSAVEDDEHKVEPRVNI